MNDDSRGATAALVMSTIAFTICFAAWLVNGVLVTWLVNAQAMDFSRTEMGWLIGLPILTGSILRLPAGILTDRYGGRRVFTALLVLSALPMFALAAVDSFFGFAVASLGFGLAGASFAVGIAYVAVWYPKDKIGTALGIFGAGNAGAALTSLFGPSLLTALTANGENIEGWRRFPIIYGAILLLTAVAFYALTQERRLNVVMTLAQRLEPLRHVRVWRFGLYYIVVFGCFVALAQWLIPYYVNVYGFSVATAGLLASIFSLPSGVIRALGGWLSDRFGARKVMYWVLSTTLIGCVLLSIPRMEIQTPGPGAMARIDGRVSSVSPERLSIGAELYPIISKPENLQVEGQPLLPVITIWQEPVVGVGEAVKRRQLLARGVTHVSFAANPWVLTALILIVGLAMGIGKAAVYKHIPDYFPDAVGVTGGMVGVIGGLGGFVGPILFGWMLNQTGVWTTCWMFIAALALVSLVWMHIVIQRMLRAEMPGLAQRMDNPEPAPSPA